MLEALREYAKGEKSALEIANKYDADVGELHKSYARYANEITQKV